MSRQSKKPIKSTKKIKTQKMVRTYLSATDKPVGDLTRLRKMSDKEIEQGILNDPDAYPTDLEWPKDAKVILPKNKVAISLRIDADVLNFYKHEGPGYLSFMNAVLRAYMQSHQQQF